MSAGTHPTHLVSDTPSPAPASDAHRRKAQAHLPLTPSSQEEGGRKRHRPSLPLLPTGEKRAGVRWGRSSARLVAFRGARRRRTPGGALVAGAVCALALLVVAPLDASANSYSRGNWDCSDFKGAEQRYKSNPEGIYRKLEYAHCLITRGDDFQGMNILHNIVESSTEPARVKAAWMVANYVKTGGTFEDTTDENNINEAIEAYGKVISFINSDPRYPDGNEIYEEESQIELKSHYRLPLLYFAKFKHGAAGSDHVHLLSSPTYDGDRDLNTYPEYSPYTLDSLNKMIEFADECLKLPRKRHFNPITYKKTKAECRVLKEAAQALLPLERERLTLLNTESCNSDIFQCEEYNEILNKIIPIVHQANKPALI